VSARKAVATSIGKKRPTAAHLPGDCGICAGSCVQWQFSCAVIVVQVTPTRSRHRDSGSHL
jgi:hypothetical protein